MFICTLYNVTQTVHGPSWRQCCLLCRLSWQDLLHTIMPLDPVLYCLWPSALGVLCYPWCLCVCVACQLLVASASCLDQSSKQCKQSKTAEGNVLKRLHGMCRPRKCQAQRWYCILWLTTFRQRKGTNLLMYAFSCDISHLLAMLLLSSLWWRISLHCPRPCTAPSLHCNPLLCTPCTAALQPLPRPLTLHSPCTTTPL